MSAGRANPHESRRAEDKGMGITGKGFWKFDLFLRMQRNNKANTKKN